MKICIDGFAASNLIGTNLYSYSKELITLINSSEDLSSFILWDRFPLKFYWERLNNTKFIPIKINRISKDYSSIENFLVENNIDIYHSPNNGFSIPNNKVCKYISTIHSLYPLIDPNNSNEKYYNKFNSLVPSALEKSDKIIATSEIVKNELESILKINSSKIDIKYPKCSEIFVPKEIEFCNNFLKRHYNISSPYILFVGSITERKILTKVIELINELKPKINDLKFLILGDFYGKRETYYKQLTNLINKYSLDDSIFFLGIVKQSHLPIFYRSSLCLVDFSTYSSYPLSSVEAVNSGAIVITNKSKINTEILGESVIYSNIDEKNLIIDFIENIHKNKSFKDDIGSKLNTPLVSTDDDILSIYK